MLSSDSLWASRSSTERQTGCEERMDTSLSTISLEDETKTPHYSSSGPPWPSSHFKPSVCTFAFPKHVIPQCFLAKAFPTRIMVLICGLIKQMSAYLPAARKLASLYFSANFCRVLRLHISWSKRPPSSPRHTTRLLSNSQAIANPFQKSFVSWSDERSRTQTCVEQQPFTSGSMLSRSPTMARILAALRCLERQK